MATDHPLALRPFSFTETSGGSVRIAHEGRVVTTLKGREAARFLSRAQAADTDGQQHLMARATGNFKRGNERPAKQRGWD